MKKFVLAITTAVIAIQLQAQSSKIGVKQEGVVINNIGVDVPDQSAVLDVNSSDKGVIFPRLTAEQKSQITNPAEGLLIYNLTTKFYEYFNGMEWLMFGTPQTPPNAPTNLVATVSSSVINLTWMDTSSDETGFVIQRKETANGTWTDIYTTTADTTSYIDGPGLAHNTTYFYRVKSIKLGISSSWSDEVMAETFYQFGNKLIFDKGDDQFAINGGFSLPRGNSKTIVFWGEMSSELIGQGNGRIMSISSGSNYDDYFTFSIRYNTSVNNNWSCSVYLHGYEGNGATTGQIIPMDYNKHLFVMNIDYSEKHISVYEGELGKLLDITFSKNFTTPLDEMTSNWFGKKGMDFLELRIIKDRIIEDPVEIAAIYNNGNGSNWIDENIPLSSHDALWRFDEFSGNIAMDESANGLHWTLENFADTGFGTKISVSGASGSFTVGEIVTGNSSEATGVVVSETGGVLTVKQVKGRFTDAETLTESNTGVTATVNSTITGAWDET